jgi:hypothetical protein
MRCKSFGELRFVAEHPHHGGLTQSRNYGVFHRPGGRNAPRPSGQTALTDKISGFEESDDCFLTLGRDNRDFDPAFSNVEDGIGGVTVVEYDVTLPVLGDGDSAIRLGEKCLRVEFGLFLRHDGLPVRASVTGRIIAKLASPDLESCAMRKIACVSLRAVWPAEWHPCTRIPCRSDRSRALR